MPPCADVKKAVEARHRAPGHRQHYVEDMAGGDVGPRHGLVGRRPDAARPRPEARPGLPVGPRRRGRDALDRQHGHPEGRDRTRRRPSAGSTWYYVPANAATIEAWVNYVCPVKGAKEAMLADRPGPREQPADLPARRLASPAPHRSGPTTRRTRRSVLGPRRSRPRRWASSGADAARRSACSAPARTVSAARCRACSGCVVFYVYPAVQMFLVSLWTGNLEDGYQQTWNFGIYPRRSPSTGRGSSARSSTAGWPRSSRSRSASRWPTPSRSAAAATRTCCCSSSSRRSSRASCCGRSRGRSSSPTTGWCSGRSRDVGILPDEFRLLATPAAVIAGITYNFLPFMTLPLYVALEKIDQRLHRGGRGPVRRSVATAGHRSSGLAIGGVLGLVVGLVMDYGPFALSIPFGAVVGARRSGPCSSARRSSGSRCRWRCPASSPGRC